MFMRICDLTQSLSCLYVVQLRTNIPALEQIIIALIKGFPSVFQLNMLSSAAHLSGT